MSDVKEKAVAKPSLLKNRRPTDKAERIEMIKKAIDEGRYEIDPERIAEKLMAKEEETTD